MHDFLYLCFNEDEQGQRAFDGIDNWIGGGTGVSSTIALRSRGERIGSISPAGIPNSNSLSQTKSVSIRLPGRPMGG
jgi:hypothetical protein